MRMTKHWISWVAALGVLCTLTLAKPAAAQDVQITGPLAGAPAVRHMRIYRAGRFQIQPFAGFTLQDEYTRTILAGAQLNFHLTDWLAIGVWGGYGVVHLDTSLTDEVVAQGQTTPRNRLSLPNRQNFAEQIGLIQWMAAPQLSFIPLRGKLALFQKIFVDADFYLFGGVAFVGLEERAAVEDPVVCASPNPNCDATQLARESRMAIAPTFGAGLMLYINDFLGLSFEWRGVPFAWNTSGTDEAGPDGTFPDQLINEDDRIFHFNHMVNIGLAVYLPAKPRISE